MSFRRVKVWGVLRAGAGVSMAVLAACSADQQSAMAPSVPPPPAAHPSVLGMVEAQVDSTGHVTFTPLGGPSGMRIGSGVNGNVYGTQGVNVLLYSDPIVRGTNGGNATWSFNVGVQNLEGFPIGTSQGGIVPDDTLGVFVAIVSPLTITSGSCVVNCNLTFNSAMGTGFFTAANQQFVYWHQILGATFGPDTTRVRKPFAFSAAKKVTGFRFMLEVGAAWPPGHGQTAWNVSYNGASGATPDDTTMGGPPWKRTNMTTIGSLANETPGPPLNLNSGGNTGPNIYLYRADSLDAAAPAAMQATLAFVLNSNKQPTAPETVFGLADNSGHLAMVGISRSAVGFVTFAPALNPTWGFISPTWQVARTAGTTSATYALHKFGTDHVTLDINGRQVLSIPYDSLLVKTVLLPIQSSAFFGVGSVTRATSVNWSNVSYTIGSTTLGNGAP